MQDYVATNWCDRRRKGCGLLGFFDLVLPSGWILRGISLHATEEGKRFVGVPIRQYEWGGTMDRCRMVGFVNAIAEAEFQRIALKAVSRIFPEKSKTGR